MTGLNLCQESILRAKEQNSNREHILKQSKSTLKSLIIINVLFFFLINIYSSHLWNYLLKHKMLWAIIYFIKMKIRNIQLLIWILSSELNPYSWALSNCFKGRKLQTHYLQNSSSLWRIERPCCIHENACDIYFIWNKIAVLKLHCPKVQIRININKLN